MVLVIIQAGIWFHGQQLVDAAAREGARSGRMEGGSLEDATARAHRLIEQMNAPLDGAPTVVVTRDAQMVKAEVRGRVHSVIPGLTVEVAAQATSPTEQFEADS